MKIVVAIPAYNEEKTLPSVINEINEIKGSDKFEILVVDDGSIDKTAQIAKSLGANVIQHGRNKGLAEAFRTEMKACQELGADIIVQIDADGQYVAKHIPELIEKVKEGYDLVLGNRFKFKIKHMAWINFLGNKAFARVISSLIKTKISDTTTGFRAFTKEVASGISYINTFTFTQEQIIKASMQGFSIAEVPVHTRETRGSRLFKSPFEYAARAWINIFRIYRDYNPLRFFGRIGLFSLLISTTIGFYFIYLHLTSGITGHLGLLFLMLMTFMFGIQTILFGFLADMMKK